MLKSGDPLSRCTMLQELGRAAGGSVMRSRGAPPAPAYEDCQESVPSVEALVCFQVTFS